MDSLSVSFFSIFMLLVISASVLLQRNRHFYTTRLFIALSLSTILVLIQGILISTKSIMNHDTPLTQLFYYSSFVLFPLPIAFWISYFDYKIYQSWDRLWKRFFYTAPIALIIIIEILLQKDFFITRDGMGMHLSGRAIGLVLGLSYIPVIYSLLMLVRNKRKIDCSLLLSMAFFLIIPLIGAAMQILRSTPLNIWPAVSLAILFVYVLAEIRHESRDYLTGLNNRKQADEWLRFRIDNIHREGSFFLVIMDMDDFKTINDQFGHHEGDEALVAFSRIISRSIKQKDFSARMGGDEFMLILDTDSTVVVEKVLNRINTALSQNNLYHDKNYSISFSAGFAYCDTFQGLDLKELVKEADYRMYLDKQKNKKNISRGLIKA